MKNTSLKKITFILFLISICIYIAQIMIFRNVHDTFFYILQDLAFMPITIAIATLLVNHVISEHERDERIEKTRMLTSVFYTEVGTHLTKEIFQIADNREEIANILLTYGENDNLLDETKSKIRNLSINVSLDEESYTNINQELMDAKQSIITLSSNPLLFEHEEFTDLLWAIFHLIDEYQLRGVYTKLTDEDLSHLGSDYGHALKLLLICYIDNAKYLSLTYPNLYKTARKRIESFLH